ncbi:DUF3108 domain-containing protein [Anaeromyxobacter sp. Fw109-5]|uniref:DUF3108 domain-containing protein n=1 Tax=Anaeromyxobacter sp. (strain Fw109-5) TaxID=404589 RepID=UPI0000ED6D67|nr:DUF3108 domain-containing protein [Anaeromyxobacter sp. Fw109-5]ABS28302.1 conserved hypothetical protein [Anaeromyxobacter sp. Fw109-5]
MASIAAALAALSLAGVASPESFAPGEEALFEVRYLNVVAGEARIAVGRPEGSIWPVFFQARTRGVAGLVDVREHLVSYWDVKSRLPRGSELRAFEAGDLHVDRSRFDRQRGKATWVRERKGRRSERTFDVPEGAHELTSAFLWLRLQPLAPGDRHELPILSGRRQFSLVAEVRGREEVETPAGRFPCVRVDVQLPIAGRMSTRGAVALWLTDDPRHVLVRLEAPFSVGEVVGVLTRYSPGTVIHGARRSGGQPPRAVAGRSSERASQRRPVASWSAPASASTD